MSAWGAQFREDSELTRLHSSAPIDDI